MGGTTGSTRRGVSVTRATAVLRRLPSCQFTVGTRPETTCLRKNGSTRRYIKRNTSFWGLKRLFLVDRHFNENIPQIKGKFRQNNCSLFFNLH